MGIFIWNLDGKIVEANEAFLHIAQYDREDLVSGRIRWTDLTPPEWRDCDEHALADLKVFGRAQPYEKEFFQKDGNRVPVLVGGALFEEGGNEGVAFVLDLSEQKRVQKALQRSEAYLAEAQRLSHAGSFGWRVSSGELWWSEESFRIFGYDSGAKPSIELVLQRVHPEDKAVVGQTIEHAQRDRADFHLEHRLLMPDGSIKHVRVAAHAWQRGESGDIEFVGSVMDITGTKQAEQEIQALNERLLRAQEEERTRIARELHDGLNQEIAAVALALSRIRPLLKDTEPQAEKQLEKVRQRLFRLSSSVRDLSHQLHPVILEYSDLATALADASAEFSSATGVTVSFKSSGPFDAVPHAVALCVYRIAQEALQNVAKHAAAREASVDLARTEDGLRLTVSDRGVGFHPSQARASGGLGLVSMRERVRLVGGVLAVESQPDHGTTLTVEIPLSDIRARSIPV